MRSREKEETIKNSMRKWQRPLFIFVSVVCDIGNQSEGPSHFLSPTPAPWLWSQIETRMDNVIIHNSFVPITYSSGFFLAVSFMLYFVSRLGQGPPSFCLPLRLFPCDHDNFSRRARISTFLCLVYSLTVVVTVGLVECAARK